MPVFTAHYGESPYKTCLYRNFLNLYGGGEANSITAHIKVERRYGRKRAAIAAGRGAHLHANWSFSPPPTLMAMKLPTIGNHI